jgi:hypothetical protein
MKVIELQKTFVFRDFVVWIYGVDRWEYICSLKGSFYINRRQGCERKSAEQRWVLGNRRQQRNTFCERQMKFS